MRTTQLMLVLLFTGITASKAQVVSKNTLATAKISVPTVQCNMCKDAIQRYFLKEEGVKSMVVDVKKKTATVKYYTDRTNIENIKTAIANTGYDADDVKATEDAYNALPKCCKKPEDGGGPPPKKKG